MTLPVTLRAKILILMAVSAGLPGWISASPIPDGIVCYCNTNKCDCNNKPPCPCVQSTVVASRLNILKGAMEDDYQVLSPGNASPGALHFGLAYSSRNAAIEFNSACNTSLGFGWAHTYSTFLFIQQGDMFRRDDEGRVVKFSRQPGTQPVLYKPAAGMFEVMMAQTNGAFTIDYPDGTIEEFTNIPGCRYFFKSPLYQMTSRKDRNGNATVLAYDAAGRLVTVTDPYGRVLMFTYDADDRIQTVTDPLGHVTQFGYSAFGAQLLRITDPLGHAVQYQYDELYRVTQKTHKNGDVFFYTYGDGFLQAEYLNPDHTRKFLGSIVNTNNWALNEALLLGQLKTEYLPSSVTWVDALSNRWLYSYDVNAYPVTIIPPGQTRGRSLAYDPATVRPIADTDANGNTTSRQYDAFGNVLAETNCSGQVTRYTYETNFNQLTSITDPNGFVTTNRYDVHGNLIQQTDPLGCSQFWSYDVHGQALTEVDKNGNLTRHYYDQSGNCTNTTDALGNVTTFSYDAAGNVLSRTDANLHVSVYAYDALGRVVATTNGLFGSASAGFAWGAANPQLAVTLLPDGSLLFQWSGAGLMLARTRDLTLPFEDVLVNGLPVTNSPFQVRAPLTNASEFYQLHSAAGGVQAASQLGPVSSASQSFMHYTYDPDGDRNSMTDANGNTTGYGYDERGRLTSITNPLGGVFTITRDAAGNKISETDANGHTTWSAYDAQNRLVGTTNALGYVAASAYDLVGNQTSTTDANGHTTTFAYDCLNRLIAETNALGYVTQYEYDAGPGGGGCGCGAGTKGTSHIIKKTDGNGKVTYFKYDPLGRLVKAIRKQGDTADLIDGDDAVTTWTYDANGNRTVLTDANGISTCFGFDALNRQISSTNGAGDVTLTSYDPVGNILTTAAPNGNVATNVYDSLNHLIEVDDALGRVVSMTYDNVGNRLSSSDGNTNTVQYAYDALNRLVTTTDALGRSIHYAYDPVGNLTHAVDRMTNATSYAYDALNRRTNVVDAAGDVTAYAYDGVGNVVAATDARNHTTRYEYDAVNQMTRTIYPDSTNDTRQFTRDGVGNLSSCTDQQGHTTLYSYNDLYYLIQRSSAADPPERFAYDLAGRLLSAAKTNWLTAGDWVVTFAYDLANRVTNTSQGGRAVQYAYDIPGRSRAMTYPGGTNIVERTDVRGRLVAIEDGGAAPVATYTYDPANRVLTRGYRNGVQADYAYNPDNGIVSLLHTNPATAGLIAGFAYAYDREDNKLYEQDLWNATRSEAFGYDPEYRLTNWLAGNLEAGSIPSPTSSQQWQLDPLGNWEVSITNGMAQARTYDEVNELVAIGANAIHYDPNGNLTNDESFTYAYDSDNRLVKVTRNADGAVVWAYAYDAFGRRIEAWSPVAASAGPTNRFFYYANHRLIEEQDASSATTATYVYGNYVDEILTMRRSGHEYYYHQNGVWSVAAVTDAGAAVAERYSYLAYGSVSIADAAGTPLPLDAVGFGHSGIGNSFLFTGRQLEESTDLYYYQARYYHARLGRFLQRDPLITSASEDLYLYVNGQPTEAMDPLGLDVVEGKCSKIGPYDFDLAKYFKIKLPIDATLTIQGKKCDCCDTATGRHDVIITGGVSGKVTTPTVETTIPFTIWFIPMVADVEGHVSGSVSVTATYNGCTGVDTLSGGGAVCADLKGSLGIGVVGASVGIYGSVEVCVNAKATGSAKSANLDIWGSGSGEIGAYASLWPFGRKDVPILTASGDSPHTVINLW